jgi:hypothetical protein
MKRFRVVSITNNTEDYPESKDDTLEFPGLIEDVEDEQELFVIDLEADEIYKASDFFYSFNVRFFTVE